MIDLTTKQLSAAVIGLASIGAPAYYSITESTAKLNTNVAVIGNKVENTEQRISTILSQLDKIDGKLDQLNNKGKR